MQSRLVSLRSSLPLFSPLAAFLTKHQHALVAHLQIPLGANVAPFSTPEMQQAAVDAWLVNRGLADELGVSENRALPGGLLLSVGS